MICVNARCPPTGPESARKNVYSKAWRDILVQVVHDQGEWLAVQLDSLVNSLNGVISGAGSITVNTSSGVNVSEKIRRPRRSRSTAHRSFSTAAPTSVRSR